MKRLMEIIGDREKLTRFIRENETQLKRIGIVALLVIAGFAAFAINGSSDGAEVVEGETEAQTEVQETSTIFVDIGGAVNTPMLAELPENSRVEDAIRAAGGLTEDADLSGINRAEFLEDGEKVYIPCLDEEAGRVTGLSQQEEASGKVNINTADSTTLQTLNGVGPATAEKIIDYRSDNGSFRRPEDLKNVSGIGDKTYEKLKDYITI
ncbi:MAG: helix-hairpin-helix domain-containing protein [Lentihominibacter sp.]|nr:helix-hairpin-helix domain-containing protein [Clostridiales bacterium]MDD6764103.1 helix-hairpin-helix domain-containing protein [Bacillota bacterium]MDY5606998.1 helix-hairpin-helix domain-containing protein [Lentihominibacter sp.]MDD6979647.1 helix-hairpin-helix domain-containing protein [Bacillota bacterium]MDD7130497.1 helix-hairpin-helix domain-containing protein [Bacillota bacterium]